MTNKEALVAVVQVSVDDNVLEKSLLDQNITSSDSYASTNASQINTAAIDVLEGLLSAPNVSEGGYSVNYDRQAIQQRLKALYNTVGLEAPNAPVIKDASCKW